MTRLTITGRGPGATLADHGRPAATRIAYAPEPAPKPRALQRGFSLLELAVGVAIVGVLLAIAIRGYDEHTRATRRADARRVLLEAAVALEQNFALAGRYDRDAAGNEMATGNVPRSPPFPPMLRTAGSEEAPSYDTVFAEPPDADRFTLVARRRSGAAMEGDRCGDFTLDHTGRRGIAAAGAGATAPACWERGRS